MHCIELRSIIFQFKGWVQIIIKFWVKWGTVYVLVIEEMLNVRLFCKADKCETRTQWGWMSGYSARQISVKLVLSEVECQVILQGR